MYVKSAQEEDARHTVVSRQLLTVHTTNLVSLFTVLRIYVTH